MIKASEPAVDLIKIDSPQIDLIHEKARLRLDQYQRRRRSGPATSHGRVESFSYDQRDFNPLGLQLFRNRVKPSPLPLRGLAGGRPEPHAPHMAPTTPKSGAVIERETQSYRLADQTTGNPYRWELDLCSMTLANFSYRNMTLVRDYTQLLEGDEACDAFDQIFSLEAKPVDRPGDELPLRDQHLVVAADATQVATIARARAGGSFIIQGPPGTGKSQTITNLIADYVAQGKRVLFVCEKRAAIDVVFARLQHRASTSCAR